MPLMSLLQYLAGRALEADVIAPSAQLRREYQQQMLLDLRRGAPLAGLDADCELPIILRRDERILWLFGSATLVQLKSKRHMAGRSAGVSLRVAKGVSLRLGASRGHAVTSEHLTDMDRGTLIFTQRNFHFCGQVRSFAIPVRKVVSITEHGDRFGVTKDGSNPKPVFFRVADIDFAAELARLIASYEECDQPIAIDDAAEPAELDRPSVPMLPTLEQNAPVIAARPAPSFGKRVRRVPE